MIDAAQWLASRKPAPPLELSERLGGIVRDARVADLAALADLFLAEAAALIENLGDDRNAAANLLAADALITYAMEAATADHDNLDDIAERAIQMIARVASGGGET